MGGRGGIKEGGQEGERVRGDERKFQKILTGPPVTILVK